MSVTLQKEGVRTYVIGDTYPIKDQLKEQGCHFDRDRKQWWIGSGKASVIEKIIQTGPVVKEEKPEDSANIEVVGKATYKGKTYYVRWQGYSEKANGFRAHLVSLDGKLDFWKESLPSGQPGDDSQVAVITKIYPYREYRGREIKQTLGSIRRFIEQQKNPETRSGECTECGQWGPSGQTCKECHEGTHL